MKVIRCKDCAKNGRYDCLLAVIENRELCFIERNDMFYCGKAEPKDGYKESYGDHVRNMTDNQMAEWINGLERDAYCFENIKDWEKNKQFWRGFLKHPYDEDYEVGE